MAEFNPELPIYLVRLDGKVKVRRPFSLQIFLNVFFIVFRTLSPGECVCVLCTKMYTLLKPVCSEI